MDTYERDNLSVEPLSDHDAEEEDLLSNPGTVIKEKQMEKKSRKNKEAPKYVWSTGATEALIIEWELKPLLFDCTNSEYQMANT